MSTVFLINAGIILVVWSGIMYTIGYWRSDKHFEELLQQLIDDGVLTTGAVQMAVNRIVRKRKGLQ